MQFTRKADRLMVSYITGPTHNVLEFTFGPTRAGSDKAPLVVFDKPSEGWPLDDVTRAVLDGIADAGDWDGAAVRSIRVLGSDTPAISIYRRLARSLIEYQRRDMQSKQIEALG